MTTPPADEDHRPVEPLRGEPFLPAELVVAERRLAVMRHRGAEAGIFEDHENIVQTIEAWRDVWGGPVGGAMVRERGAFVVENLRGGTGRSSASAPRSIGWRL